MTLTNNQVSLIRLKSGDNISPFLVPFEHIQLVYDDSASMDETIYHVVQLALDALTAERTRLGDKPGRETLDARIDNLKDKLKFYKEQAGLYGAPLTVGEVDFGIDEEYDEDDY
jgi:hypothetical protein